MDKFKVRWKRFVHNITKDYHPISYFVFLKEVNKLVGWKEWLGIK